MWFKMLHSERRIQSGLGQGWLKSLLYDHILSNQTSTSNDPWVTSVTIDVNSLKIRCFCLEINCVQTLWWPGHELSDNHCPVCLQHVICSHFYGYSFIKTGNSNKLYQIHVVNPLKNTNLNINKTRIRRKIYPYRKCWKYPWRKCDCQGKCDIYWPCSKLNNSTEK